LLAQKKKYQKEKGPLEPYRSAGPRVSYTLLSFGVAQLHGADFLAYYGNQ